MPTKSHPNGAARAGQFRLLALVLIAAGYAGLAPAQLVATLRELPHGAAAAPQPSAVTRDGTVFGLDASSGNTLRWKPGQEPEDLGGGPSFMLINVMPVVSPDGSVVVSNYMNFGEETTVTMPRVWEGDFGWSILPDMYATSSAMAIGISADGTQLAGTGADGEVNRPWRWNYETGQQLLPVPATMSDGEGWAVSNDGRVVAGFVSRTGTEGGGWPRRYRFAARWSDGQIQLLEDADGHPLGQAVVCNADCSIVAGGGEGGDSAPHANSGRAWYWSEAEGAVYLDTSGLPDGAMAPYYAMDMSGDGSVVVGTYTIQVETPFGVMLETRPFRWTREGGAKCLIELMEEQGLPFGGDGWNLVPVSISVDGRTILLNGQDADSQLRSAVLTLVEDRILKDGFDGEPPRR